MHRVLLVVSLMFTMAFAGCAGEDAPVLEDPGTSGGPAESATGTAGAASTSGPGATPSPQPGVEYVDGADGSYACAAPGTDVKVDPNRTFEGPAHQHDMWGGNDKLTIFEGDVKPLSSGGWFSMPGAVVHPGTGRVEFIVSWTDQVAVVPETRKLLWDMPGDKKGAGDMLSHTFTAKGSNHSFDVNLSNNDPPHYSRTIWTFKMEPSSPSKVTWIIHRGYDCLPIDPPHYEGWGGATQKLLWEGTTTHTNLVRVCPGGANCGGSNLYQGMSPSGNSSVPPGTQTVRVTLEWMNERPNQPPLCLVFKSATAAAGSLSYPWRRATTIVENQPTRRVFDITAGPEDWDSPYKPATFWSYNWCFDNGSMEAFVGDAGLFSGTVTWKMQALRGS